MYSPSNEVNTVMCLYLKYQPSAIYLHKFDFGSDFQSRWCRGNVAHINMGTHRLFFRPVKERVYRLDAGPFDQPDHVASCKNVRHCLELI